MSRSGPETTMSAPANEELDGAGLQILDRPECLQFLARGGTGRVAVNVGALPLIMPIRFALDRERLVFCVGAGSTLDRATGDAVVAFEVDGHDSGRDWSVSLVGIARRVSDGVESARAEELPLPRWWSDRPHRFVSISTEHLTGRRAAAPC